MQQRWKFLSETDGNVLVVSVCPGKSRSPVDSGGNEKRRSDRGKKVKMKKQEFIEKHRSDERGYCPCVVDTQGDVYECPKGHLEALMELGKENVLLNEIPDDISPLFYMIFQTEAVAVDYENQVYCGELTQEQRYALIDLSENGLIHINLKQIHKKVNC